MACNYNDNGAVASAYLPEFSYDDAEYGETPFDVFALERWDYALPREADQRQWDDLVCKYLAIPEPERMSQPDNFERVLRPHQSAQERSISSRINGGMCHNPVWLRTCYDPDLEDQYADLVRAADPADDVSLGPEFILDDASLYDFGSDRDEIVDRIVRRIPKLADTYQLSVEEDYLYVLGPAPADGERELEKASFWVRSLLCVVDKDAIQRKTVKLFWLGSDGKCLWWNEMRDPGQLCDMPGTFRDGCSLEEAIECHEYCTEGERGSSKAPELGLQALLEAKLRYVQVTDQGTS